MKAMGVLALDGARFWRRCSGVLQLCIVFFILTSVVLGMFVMLKLISMTQNMFFIFLLTGNEGHRLDLGFGE